MLCASMAALSFILNRSSANSTIRDFCLQAIRIGLNFRPDSIRILIFSPMPVTDMAKPFQRLKLCAIGPTEKNG